MVSIGIIADTHVPDVSLPRDLIKRHFCGVDRILHAGDLVDRRVLDFLGSIAPVTAVSGNSDYPVITAVYPATATVSLADGVTAGIVHRFPWHDPLGGISSLFPGQNLQVLVFGHTHTPFNQFIGSTLFFNPGSPVVTPGHPTVPSVGIITIPSGSRQAHGSIVLL